MDTRAEKKIKNIAEKKDVKPSEKNINDCDKVNVISLLVALIAISTIGFIYLDECKKCFNHCQHTITQNYEESSTNFGKAFKVFGKNVESGYLRHVFHVLDRIGYQNNPNNTDWDLLWAHDYPFRVLYQELKALKPHQKVNHFPGCGYLTNKVDLATSNLKYIPSAFKLPEHKDKLLEYSSQNPTKKFVVKNNEHRHVHVKDISEISLEDNNTFVQEFIDNPLLVSGHMFDIGVYTVITSIDSLRIYIYHGDVLLRFCPEQYYPFDSNNLDKYVVGDDYLPIWEVPGLTKYYEDLGFGMRESLSAYLAAKGQDSSKIWSQIEDAINISILAKQKSIINIVKRFKSKRNFFEMMRFDFIVDEDLNVHLMEANMSPNLSSAHFKPNQLLYEQVIFNLFGLVGVAPRLQSESLIIRSKEEQLMQSADKNVAVMHQLCASNQCKDCELFECQLCKSCWTSQLKQDLLDAHNEHLNRGDCKRIFPPTMVQNGKLPDNFADYAPNNQLMYLWFQEKCNIDQTWSKCETFKIVNRVNFKQQSKMADETKPEESTAAEPATETEIATEQQEQETAEEKLTEDAEAAEGIQHHRSSVQFQEPIDVKEKVAPEEDSFPNEDAADESTPYETEGASEAFLEPKESAMVEDEIMLAEAEKSKSIIEGLASSASKLSEVEVANLKREALERKKAKALGSIMSIRRGDQGIADRLKAPKYQNSYKLESDKPFNPETVQAILKEVLEESMSELSYEPDKVAKQVKWASGAIRAKVRAQEYDRYKIVCYVSIGEKLCQDVCCMLRFLWDPDRDRYAMYVHENMQLFALALCFGIYYE